MSGKSPQIIVLRNAQAFAPGELGQVDIVIAAGKILAIEPAATIEQITGLKVSEIDLEGALLMPALVDQHCHPLGGGGWAGYGTLNEAIAVTDFLSAGIGSLAGVLGNDTSVRLPASLLGRIRYLSAKGLTALMYTGEIAYPAVSIHESLADDIALIPEVVGIKAAVGEAGQAILYPEQLAAMHSQAAKGAHTAGIDPLIHIHLGNGLGGVELIARAIGRETVPAASLVLTHVNWSQAVLDRVMQADLADVGLDVTACIRPDYFGGSVAPAQALAKLLKSGLRPELITASSDAGGSHVDGESGELVVHTPRLLFEVLRELLLDDTVTPSSAIATVTLNPANRLGLTAKGRIEVGADADLLILDENYEPSKLLLAGIDHSEVLQ